MRRRLHNTSYRFFYGEGTTLLKLSVILIVVLFTAACASSPNVEQQANTSMQALPTGETGEPLVALVNGEGITLSEFQQALARTEQQFVAADARALQATVLDTLIEQTLIEQAAAAQNVIVTDEALETEFQANKALASDQQAWEQWLKDNLYTEGEFRTSLRGALIAGVMRDRLTQDISDTMLHVHARHILVDSEQAALDVLARLRNGEDFAALAASLSKDVTTRGQGGDLGWFVEGELLEPVLTQVAFSLNNGQIGGPVATRLGYHIIQKLDSEPRPLTPDRRAMLAQFRFESWVSGLTFNAIIERFLA
jgi:peptidyl-prolyl cis-trans isomerase C